MVLRRTENILICIMIVYSVKILEFTIIKYFQKVIIKVQQLGGLYNVMLVNIRSFKKDAKKLKMSVSYQSSRMYLILYLKSKNASA